MPKGYGLHHVSKTGKQRTSAQQAATERRKRETLALARAKKDAQPLRLPDRSWWLEPSFYTMAKQEAARMRGEGEAQRRGEPNRQEL